MNLSPFWAAEIVCAWFPHARNGRFGLLRCDSAGVGALPLPAAPLSRILLDALRQADILPEGAIDDNVIVLDNDWVWPNGKPRYRLADITFSDTKIHLRLEPLP